MSGVVAFGDIVGVENRLVHSGATDHELPSLRNDERFDEAEGSAGDFYGVYIRVFDSALQGEGIGDLPCFCRKLSDGKKGKEEEEKGRFFQIYGLLMNDRE